MKSSVNTSAAFVFVTLLIKIGVVALLGGFIARFGRFRSLILVEQRSPRQKLELAAFLGVPFMLGVLTRLLARYQGTDLGLEATVLAGLLGGTIVGLVVGMMVSLPAWLIGGEFLAVPMGVLYAVVAGFARYVFPDKGEGRRVSPFFRLRLYRSLPPRFKPPAMDWPGLFSPRCCPL